MNVFTGVMLVFAIAGFADKIFGFRWGLTDSFDKGLMTMGTMVVPIVGVCTIGVEFIERHAAVIPGITDALVFDPSLIAGAVLAPDLGGYFIARELAATPELLIINGVVLGTLLGQAVCFQLPVFLSVLGKEHRPLMLKGFLVGITVIPAGMLAAEAILRMNFILFLKQFVPVLAACLLVALGLYKVPDIMVKGFMIVGKIIQLATNLMFAAAVLGMFVPRLRYASMESVEGALLIVFKSAIIISGALVMSELILKLFGDLIQKAADRLGTNKVSVVCMLMNCATSLAILPLFDKMDDRGRKMNCAFSISGAYVIGGSMAFVSAVSSGYVVLIFFVSKLVSGLLSMYIMYRMDRRDSRSC